MTLLYSLNGLTLNNPAAGYKLLDATQWAGTLQTRHNDLSVPGSHGIIPVWNEHLQASTLALRVRVFGDNAEEVNQRWNELIRHIGVTTNRPVNLQRFRTTIDDDEGGHANTVGQVVSMEVPDFTCVSNFADTTIVLSLPEARWYGDEEDNAFSIPGSEQTSPLLDASTMPITGMMWRCDGPISSLNISDDVSQTGFAWSGATVSTGEWLLVDLTTFTAWWKTTDDWELTGTNVSANLRSTGIGWLQLSTGIAPGFAGPSVTIGASGTSGATTCTLRSRRTYH